MVCIPLLEFAEAYAVYKRANKSELKNWRGNKMLQLIQEQDFEDVAGEAE